MNYDTTQIGAPYVRVNRLTIVWPAVGQPTAEMEQSLAVKLATGEIRTIDPLPTIGATLDFAVDGNTPIPLVDFETGAELGIETTLNQVMLGVLAVIRAKQREVQG